MKEYLFQGGYKNKAGEIKVNLLLIHFKDENKINFIYSPHLDLTGYGHNLKEAKDSFAIVFEDFIDYTLKKNTLGKILTNLGWDVKESLKKPKKVLSPSITSVISKNDYVSEIFDKYPIKTFHQKVGIPTFL